MTSIAERRLRDEFDATAAQVARLEPIARLFESHDLVASEDSKPLYEACRCAASCWGEFEDAERPKSADAGISLPWVGPSYEQWGVVVVAINLRGYGGLMANWEIKTGRNLGKPGEIGALRDGHQKVNNSMFAYATGAYVDAVMCSLEGSQYESELPESTRCADALEGCAFLEAFKCSPANHLSRPGRAMVENCPPQYLLDELQLLEPRAIVVLGDLPTSRLRALAGNDDWSRQGELQRGTLKLGGRDVDVLGCRHPAAPGQRWRGCHSDLSNCLRETPLATL
jgi:hypothetical protein